jgi:ATP-dependent Clp protease ATP-binding subunit ClpC
VQPATEAQTIKILEASKGRFEKFHGVQYAEDALTAAVVYSNRHIKDRFLPDKAIDLIDDAGAFVKMQREKASLPDDLRECEKHIKFIVHQMENAIASHQFEKARYYSEEERKEREKLRELRQKYNVQNPQASTVTVEHVNEVLARWTGMPIAAIREDDLSNLAVETELPSTEATQRKKPKGKNPS